MHQQEWCKKRGVLERWGWKQCSCTLLSWFQLRLGMFVSSSWKVILPDRIPSAKHLVVLSKWFSWEILTRSVLYGREVTCAKPHGNDAGLQISSVVPPVSCRPSKRALRSAVKVKTNCFTKCWNPIFFGVHVHIVPQLLRGFFLHRLKPELFPPEASPTPTQHI